MVDTMRQRTLRAIVVGAMVLGSVAGVGARRASASSIDAVRVRATAGVLVYPNVGIQELPSIDPVIGGDSNSAQVSGILYSNLVKLNTYHVSLFGKFLEKMRSTPDGDGSLLDHSIILYGSGMSESNNHLRFDVPTLLVGGGAGLLKGNRHIKAPKETPLANFMLDLANKFGVEIDKFGISTGRLDV